VNALIPKWMRKSTIGGATDDDKSVKGLEVEFFLYVGLIGIRK
jgi:hypothetical protein